MKELVLKKSWLWIILPWIAILAVDSWTTVQGVSRFGIEAEINPIGRWFMENLGIVGGTVADRLIFIPFGLILAGGLYWVFKNLVSSQSAKVAVVMMFALNIMTEIVVVRSNFSQLY